MAASFISNIGTATSAGVAASSLVVTLTAGVAVGDTAIFGVIADGTSTPTITTISDSRGNTWVVDKQFLQGTSVVAGIISSRITVALISGDTVTINYSASILGRAAAGASFRGLYGFSRGGSNGTGGNSTGTTATATGAGVDPQADTLSVVCVAIGSAASAQTVGAGYSNFQAVNTTSTIRHLAFESAVDTTNTGVARSGTVTWTTAAAWAAVIAVYEADVQVGPAVPDSLNPGAMRIPGSMVFMQGQIYPTPPAAVTNPLTLAAAVTAAAVVQNRAGALRVAAVSATVTALRGVSKALTAAVSATVATVRSVNTALTAAVAATPTAAKQLVKTWTASATATGVRLLQVGKPLTAATGASVATLVRRVGKLPAASVTATASAARRTAKGFGTGNGAAFVQVVATANGQSGVSTTTVLTLGAGVQTTTGNTLIMAFTRQITSVADSRGNTWTADKNLAGTNVACGIASARITVPLTAGDTITITHGSQGGRAAIACEYSGLLTASFVDSAAFGSAADNVGATTETITGAATTTAFNELVVAAFALDNLGSSIVQGAGYTLRGTAASTGTIRTIGLEDAFTTVPGVQSASASWTGSATNVAIIGAYKAVNAGVPVTAAATLSRNLLTTLTATVAATATVVASLVRRITLTAAVTATATAARQVGKPLTATATATGTLARQTGKPLSAATTATATLTRKTLKTLAAAVTATATVATQVFSGSVTNFLTLTASVTATAVRTLRVGHAASATVTAAATLTRSASRTLTAAAATAATATRRTARALTASASATPTVVRQVGKQLSATATITATASKRLITTLTAAVATTATLTRTAGKPLAATVTATGTLTKRAAKSLAAAVTATATLARSTAKLLSAAVTAVAAATRRTARTLTASVTATATIAAIKVFLLTLVASVTATAARTLRVGKVLAPAVTATATVLKAARNTFTASVTAVAVLTRRAGKALSATVTSSAVLSKARPFTLTAAVTATSTLTRSSLKLLTASVTATAALARRVGALRTATATGTAVLVKRTSKAPAAAVTTAGTLSKRVGKVLVNWGYQTRAGADGGGGFVNHGCYDSLTQDRLAAGGDTWGAHVSDDGGSHWHKRMRGFTTTSDGAVGPDLVIRATAFSKRPANAGRLYVGQGRNHATNGTGFFGYLEKDETVSVHKGTAVSGFGTNIVGSAGQPRPAGQLIVSEYDSGSDTEYIYCATPLGIQRTLNSSSQTAGDNVTTLCLPGPTIWRWLTQIDANNMYAVTWSADFSNAPVNSTVYLITSTGAPLATASSGQITATVVSGTTPSHVNAIKIIGGNHYAAGIDGVYLITGNGATWTKISGAVFTGECMAIGGIGNTLYAVNKVTSSNPTQTVLRSTAGAASTGTDWQFLVTPTNCSPLQWGDNTTWWLYGVAASPDKVNANPNTGSGSPFVCSNIEVDPFNSSRVTFWGPSGVWQTRDAGFTYRPAMNGLNGGQKQPPVAGNAVLRLDGPVGAVTCLDVDYVATQSTDALLTAVDNQSPGAVSGLSAVTRTFGGSTYTINTTKPASLSRDGVNIEDEYFRNACINPQDMQIDSDGTIYIAQSGGGTLVMTPGTSPVAAVARSTARQFATAATATASASRRSARTLVAACAAAATAARRTSHALSAPLAATATVSKRTAKTLAAAVTTTITLGLTTAAKAVGHHPIYAATARTARIAINAVTSRGIPGRTTRGTTNPGNPDGTPDRTDADGSIDP